MHTVEIHKYVPIKSALQRPWLASITRPSLVCHMKKSCGKVSEGLGGCYTQCSSLDLRLGHTTVYICLEIMKPIISHLGRLFPFATVQNDLPLIFSFVSQFISDVHSISQS